MVQETHSGRPIVSLVMIYRSAPFAMTLNGPIQGHARLYSTMFVCRQPYTIDTYLGLYTG